MSAYAIAAGHPLAVDEGRRVLAAGGNAFDAALAAGFTQCVVDPAKCGIGGWGVATLARGRGGRVQCVDFPGRAGSRASESMWARSVAEDAYHGYLPVLSGHVNDVGYGAIAVPGTVAGFAEIHRRFGSGRFAWGDLLAPAVRHARDGVPIYAGVLGAGRTEWTWPGSVPFVERLHATAASARTYLERGRCFEVGETLVQPDLAATLEIVAADGPDAFYRGRIAERMIHDLEANGALLAADDLAGYRATVSDALEGRFREHTVHAPPPPQSGISLIQMLAAVDGALRPEAGPLAPDNVAQVVAAMQFAALDRERFLGDPGFVAVPIPRMLDRARIRAEVGRSAVRVGAGVRPEATTNVTVVDGDGNAISLNHSLASHGGAGVVTEGLGFLYNNCMAGFDVRPGRPNSIAPGKARWSAACPAVVRAPGGDVTLAIGGPGGSRALTAVYQGILHVLEFGMSPLEAAATARLDAHDGVVDIEDRVPWTVAATLSALGYDVVRSYEYAFAALYLVGRDPAGRLRAAADPRQLGAAVEGVR